MGAQRQPDLQQLQAARRVLQAQGERRSRVRHRKPRAGQRPHLASVGLVSAGRVPVPAAVAGWPSPVPGVVRGGQPPGPPVLPRGGRRLPPPPPPPPRTPPRGGGRGPAPTSAPPGGARA